MLALHWAEFFPSTVGRSLEFMVVKKFGKERRNDVHNINRPRGEFCFIYQRRHLLIRLELNTSFVRLQR